MGVIKSMTEVSEKKERLVALGIHAALWIVLYFFGGQLLSIFIGLVVAAVILFVVCSYFGIGTGKDEKKKPWNPGEQNTFFVPETVQDENGNVCRTRCDSGFVYVDTGSGEDCIPNQYWIAHGNSVNYNGKRYYV